MRKKTLITLASVLLFGVLLLTAFYFFYIKKVVIWDPVKIEFPGISPDESDLIQTYGITPLNRKNIIYRREATYFWNNSGYYRALEIVVPDTLVPKIISIRASIKEKTFTFKLSDLHPSAASGNIFTYVLPPEVRSEGSFSSKLSVIFPISVLLSVLKVLGIIVAAIIILVLFIRWINSKDKPNRRRLPVWFKIICISILIACSVFFGYLLFKFTIANYMTAVLFIILCFVCLLLLIRLMVRIFKISEKNSNRILKAWIALAIIWFFAESILRIIGLNESYNEKDGFYYSSGYTPTAQSMNKKPHLYVYPEYYSYTLHTKEFKYQVKCNNEGLRDIDHPLIKDADEFRIICVGNSFTEGLGTPQDSTWPKLLEDLLKPLTAKKITVFNAGKSGSDPFFEYMLLKEELLKYHPDLVLLGIGLPDYKFYPQRGGFERFTPGGYHYRKGPGWEKLYAISYIFRFYINNILHYQSLLSPDENKAVLIKAQKATKDCLYKYYDLSCSGNFKFAVVFYDNGEEQAFPLLNEIKKENIIPSIDLYEYTRNIEKTTTIQRRQYYWPVDGHCNSRGYAMFARGVAWNLKKMGIIDSIKKE